MKYTMKHSWGTRIQDRLGQKLGFGVYVYEFPLTWSVRGFPAFRVPTYFYYSVPRSDQFYFSVPRSRAWWRSAFQPIFSLVFRVPRFMCALRSSELSNIIIYFFLQKSRGKDSEGGVCGVCVKTVFRVPTYFYFGATRPDFPLAFLVP